jgi:small subunit ribosomal protein S9
MKKRTRVLVVTAKRKTAIAKVTVREGGGKVTVNRIPLEIYGPEVARVKVAQPLILAGEAAKKLDFEVNVRGGGFMGQAEAAGMAIAKAIVKWTKSPKLKRTFMEYDRTLLVGDPRRTEPKKFGGPSARTRRQKSYR